jgi:hypothetical protein
VGETVNRSWRQRSGRDTSASESAVRAEQRESGKARNGKEGARGGYGQGSDTGSEKGGTELQSVTVPIALQQSRSLRHTRAYQLADQLI